MIKLKRRIWKVNKLQLYVALILFILGFVTSFFYEQNKSENKKSILESNNEWIEIENLQKSILAEKEQNNQLEQKLKELEKQLINLENEITKDKETTSGLSNELANARMLAGLVAVKGPGIIVVLDDSKEAKNKSDVTNYIVHEQDIRRVVNELFAAGAEAISVNGERMIATSTIRCIGPTIIVNSTKQAPPFEIKAIGESNTLITALEMPGGILENLRSWNIQISLQKLNELEIPAYVGEY